MLLVGISSVAGICYMGWICVAVQDLSEGFWHCAKYGMFYLVYHQRI